MNNILNKTKLQDIIRSLSINYDMFLTNREYRATQYANRDEDYFKEQNKLADKIKVEEDKVSEFLKDVFKQNFFELNFIAYDSRFVIYNSMETSVIGLILVEGMKAGDESKIKQYFKENYFMDIRIDKLEDLPEEIRKKFKK